jgi:hypothetical protein
MSWSIQGTFFETCSCNMLCPSWFAVPDLMDMDQGWCGTALLARVESGDCDGVDLSGTDVVVGLHFPGPTLFDGDGTARVYLSETAGEDQRQHLEAIFKGERGGPMAVTGSLVSNWLDTEVTGLDVTEEGDLMTASVGSVGNIRSERLRNEGGDLMTMQNVGFAMAFEFENATAELAPSAGTEWSDPDLPGIFSNKSGAVGRVNWTGD